MQPVFCHEFSVLALTSFVRPQAPQVPFRLLRFRARSEHAGQPDANVHRLHGIHRAGYRSEACSPSLEEGQRGTKVQGHLTAAKRISWNTEPNKFVGWYREKSCVILRVAFF